MYLTGDMALPPLTIDGITTADAMICLLTHDDMNSPMGRHTKLWSQSCTAWTHGMLAKHQAEAFGPGHCCASPSTLTVMFGRDGRIKTFMIS